MSEVTHTTLRSKFAEIITGFKSDGSMTSEHYFRMFNGEMIVCDFESFMWGFGD